jgi:hypothetical protein
MQRARLEQTRLQGLMGVRMHPMLALTLLHATGLAAAAEALAEAYAQRML